MFSNYFDSNMCAYFSTDPARCQRW